jgi:phenylpyruvate tautomerase PptA (4-oxalocrotonate tautomerase family)
MICVYGIADRLNPRKSLVSDTIHRAMRDVLGLPEDKRAQRFFPLAREDFYMPGGRTEDYIVLEISMLEGRTVETKKALIKRLFALFEEQLGIGPADLEITLFEQPAHCWGFRGMTGDEAKLDYRVNV